MKIDAGLLGSFQIYQKGKVPSKKLIIFRNLPDFAKKAKGERYNTPIQLAQQVHMMLVASQCHWLMQRYEYENPITGKKIYVSAPAAFVGIMRTRNTKNIQTDVPEGWTGAQVKETLENAAAAILVANGQTPQGDAKYASLADALAVVRSIPVAVVKSKADAIADKEAGFKVTDFSAELEVYKKVVASLGKQVPVAPAAAPPAKGGKKPAAKGTYARKAPAGPAHSPDTFIDFF
jgi:hypothetical protein